MKLVYLFVFVFLLILHLSCQNDEMVDPTAELHTRLVAVELSVHQTTVNQYEIPDPEIHPAFFGAELSLQLNDFPAGIIPSDLTKDGDTIFTYNEIPLVKETRSKVVIFRDGSSETLIEDLTPDGVNPLYLLSETPADNQSILSRTVIKNDRIHVYNRQNELILDEVYPKQDFSEFLDTLNVFVSKESVSMKIRTEDYILPAGVSKTILADGRVRMEQSLNEVPNPYAKSANVAQMKAVAVMDETLTKTLSFELYSNQKLIHQKTFVYEQDSKLINYSGDVVLSENPRSIESLTLQSDKKGEPVIFRIRTLYHKNQMIVFSDTTQ